MSSLLFPSMAKRKQYAAYQEYKKYFWWQWTGTLLIILIDLMIGLYFARPKANATTAEFTFIFVAMANAQLIFAFVFVVSKHPRDILAWFNKRPDISFSCF